MTNGIEHDTFLAPTADTTPPNTPRSCAFYASRHHPNIELE